MILAGEIIMLLRLMVSGMVAMEVIFIQDPTLVSVHIRAPVEILVYT
jgi:hypothetical protein